MPVEVGGADERIVETYPSDARLVEVVTSASIEPRYRFESLLCENVTFDDLEAARLYADVYFDVGSFCEDGTGDRGIPPAIAAAGTDTLAAYLLCRSDNTREWVESFFQVDSETLDRYVWSVRTRASKRREQHEASN